jgi:hypothetical protein
MESAGISIDAHTSKGDVRLDEVYLQVLPENGKLVMEEERDQLGARPYNAALISPARQEYYTAYYVWSMHWPGHYDWPDWSGPSRRLHGRSSWLDKMDPLQRLLCHRQHIPHAHSEAWTRGRCAAVVCRRD